MRRESFIFYLFRPIVRHIKLAIFQAEWRRRNPNNFTEVTRIFPINRVSVDRYTYGELNVHTFGEDDSKLSIGSFCSIAADVKFILGGEHPLNRISTYPFLLRVYKHIGGKSSNEDIIVEDDVWIGNGCTILSGVRIGQGAVVGAGCVVAKDVPPYGIMIKGEVKKYRFSEYCRKKLSLIQYNKLDFDKYERFVKTEIIDENVDDILKELDVIE